MASHLDLEEQEQLANFKHFWNQYGNAISWVLIVAFGAYAAYNGWQFWQRKQGQEAAVLYDELQRASQAGEVDQVTQVWADVQAKVGRALQAQQAGLLAAKTLQEAGKTEAARQALTWVVEHGSAETMQAVARLRLAALELEAQNFSQALKALDFQATPEFAPLQADRRGDVLLAQGQRDEAAQQYRKAWEGMASTPDYRSLVQAKLNALGVDPQAAQTTVKE